MTADAVTEPDDLPAPGCTASHDGHTHHVRDEYGGRGVYCCGHGAETLLIAYLKGTQDRYLDRPEVVQCTTVTELRAAARAHCRDAHQTLQLRR
jgi:hypothetical protein